MENAGTCQILVVVFAFIVVVGVAVVIVVMIAMSSDGGLGQTGGFFAAG